MISHVIIFVNRFFDIRGKIYCGNQQQLAIACGVIENCLILGAPS
jgi:hypothetical protein